jgi:ABC-2 type transport system permease protein
VSATAVGIGLPFTRLTHVELRKQVDTRAGRWLLIATALLTALFMMLKVWQSDPADLTFQALASAAMKPQMLLLPVIGLMAASSEWSQRTVMGLFTLEPRRGRVVLSKLLAAAGLGLLVILAGFASAALANVAGMLLRGGAGTWHLDWAVLGGLTTVQGLLVAQGVAFGLLLLNTPAAIVSYFIVPYLWTIARLAVPFLHGPGQWIDQVLTHAPLKAGTADAGDWARIATSGAIWIALPLLIGTWRVLRHEPK